MDVSNTHPSSAKEPSVARTRPRRRHTSSTTSSSWHWHRHWQHASAPPACCSVLRSLAAGRDSRAVRVSVACCFCQSVDRGLGELGGLRDGLRLGDKDWQELIRMEENQLAAATTEVAIIPSLERLALVGEAVTGLVLSTW